jgi:hypothetical protein
LPPSKRWLTRHSSRKVAAFTDLPDEWNRLAETALMAGERLYRRGLVRTWGPIQAEERSRKSANYDKGSTSVRTEPKDGEIVVEGGRSLNPQPPHSRKTRSVDN